MVSAAPAQVLVVAGLLLFSLADLKYRVIPGVEFFFFALALLALPEVGPFRVLPILAAVGLGAVDRIPGMIGLFLLITPPAWPALLIAYGVRREILGKADLYAIGCISLIFSLDIAITALIGMLIWSRVWKRPRPNDSLIPLVPGTLLGTIVGIVLRSIPIFGF